LTEIINETHENERYLPDVDLPENLVAVSDLESVVKDATLIIFVVPHQFLMPVIQRLKKPGVLTKGARAISAIKGIQVDGASIQIYPAMIEEMLGMPCSALG
jgi:glycerol-3-phosphate dehydrogenase (NAD+)